MKPLTTATAKSHSEKRVKKENIKTETKIMQVQTDKLLNLG